MPASIAETKKTPVLSPGLQVSPSPSKLRQAPHPREKESQIERQTAPCQNI